MSQREDQKEGVWLDKLCINQNSAEDKDVHIGAMDIIYRSARRVIILLEDIQLTQEEETAGLAYAGFYKDMGREADERNLQGQDRLNFIDTYFPSREAASEIQDLRGKAHSFGMKMLRARWFSRAWCGHESRVVPHRKVNNPLFLCYGSDGRVLPFEFRFVHYLAMYISDVVEPPISLVGGALHEAIDDPNPQTLKQMWWRAQRLMPERSAPGVSSALQHLVSVLQFGCAKLGDLMSIALNTASMPLAFSGDVKTAEDVVWMFSMMVLATNDVSPLVVDGRRVRVSRSDGLEGTTVSWAVCPHQGAIDDRMQSPRINTITGVTRDYIEMDLIVFESLPSAPSDKAFKVATKMMEDYDLANLIQRTDDETVQKQYELMKSEVHRVKGDAGPLKVFVPMWLAHAIDCGLDWALRFPDVMKADTEDSYMHGTMGEDADERLTDAANFLLDHLTSQAGEPGADRDRVRDVQGLARLLTCILDPRLSLLTISPRRLPRGNGDFAFIASGSNRSWIAIPAATAHLHAWQKRAWVIEPCNPSQGESPQDHLPDINMALNGNESAEDLFPVLPCDYADKRSKRGQAWRLRRREEIFGCQRFSGTENDAVGGAVMYLKKQRVYGGEDYDWRAISVAVKEFEAKHGPKQSCKIGTT